MLNLYTQGGLEWCGESLAELKKFPLRQSDILTATVFLIIPASFIRARRIRLWLKRESKNGFPIKAFGNDRLNSSRRF